MTTATTAVRQQTRDDAWVAIDRALAKMSVAAGVVGALIAGVVFMV